LEQEEIRLIKEETKRNEIGKKFTKAGKKRHKEEAKKGTAVQKVTEEEEKEIRKREKDHEILAQEEREIEIKCRGVSQRIN